LVLVFHQHWLMLFNNSGQLFPSDAQCVLLQWPDALFVEQKAIFCLIFSVLFIHGSFMVIL